MLDKISELSTGTILSVKTNDKTYKCELVSSIEYLDVVDMSRNMVQRVKGTKLPKLKGIKVIFNKKIDFIAYNDILSYEIIK